MSNFVKVEEGSAFVLESTLVSSSDCKAARLYMHWPDFMLHRNGASDYSSVKQSSRYVTHGLYGCGSASCAM